MFKSGFIAIVGRPNVGKSTLLNAMVQEPVSIVTHKPQTTRHKIMGVRHLKDAQLVFLDTPGIHTSQKAMNVTMVKTAYSGIEDADVVLHLIEPRLPISEEDQKIVSSVEKHQKIHLVCINKIDRVKKDELLPLIEQVHQVWHPKEVFPLSALRRDGVETLLELIVRDLPEGPAYFPAEQITDRDLQFRIGEIVREKAFLYLHQEIPYSLTVEIERVEPGPKSLHIHGLIVVEKESQKAMVIGKNGLSLKRIGTLARKDLEKLLGRKIYLELYVKVVKNWASDPHRIKEYGIS
ncbi:MAG: GTPase Era [Deltaproteobacteria bacterium]|nr:GTPase Era [Deltaproteobacteria bacterium]